MRIRFGVRFTIAIERPPTEEVSIDNVGRDIPAASDVGHGFTVPDRTLE